MNQRGSTVTWWMAVFAVLALGLAAVALWPKAPPPLPPLPPPKPPNEHLESMRAKARQLQDKGEWCPAKDAWTEFIEKLQSEGGESPDLQDEAERNLKLVHDQCEPKVPVEPNVPIEVPEPPAPPERVERKTLEAHYPKGRRVRSIAALIINGRGENEAWFVSTELNFSYVYRVGVETIVIENNGSRIVFEQHFKEVSQTRAVCSRDIRIAMPDAPLLDVVWTPLEASILKPIPQYRLVRKLADIVNVIDPGAKRTLTWVAEQLKRAGIPMDGANELELVTQIEKLSGMRVRLEYVSGLGVVSTTVLEGNAIGKEDLVRLAHNSSLLMDYFISRSGEKKVGEEWPVRAQDVSNMTTPVGVDMTVDGELTLLREPDRKGTKGLQVLSVSPGEIELRGADSSGDQQGKVSVKSGTVEYSPDDKLVQEARLSFGATLDWRSRDHLLFGTKKVRDLTIETYYEAKPIKTPEK